MYMYIFSLPFLDKWLHTLHTLPSLAFITKNCDPRDHSIVICRNNLIPFYSIPLCGFTKHVQRVSYWWGSCVQSLPLDSEMMVRFCSWIFIFCHCIFETDSRSGVAGLEGECTCNFARFSQILLHGSCIILLPHQQFMRKYVSPQHVL